MLPATRWAEEDLEGLEAKSLLRTLNEREALEGPQGRQVRVNQNLLINFSSNDYLGLANDEHVKRAWQEGAQHYGVGSGAARLVSGDSVAHCALEQKLAHFKKAEAVLLFNSGYAANVGILSSLCGPGDVIFSDALNHASLIDGCRLSRAQVVVYPHLDVEALNTLIPLHPGRRRLVCSDAVFSMEGDCAPLKELVQVCQGHNAALLVDEAHATGVFGPGGEGLCEAAGVADKVDVRMGTLGKALGVFGAFAAASQSIIDLLVNRARPFVYSTSLPAAACVAAIASLNQMISRPDLRERLWENIRFFAAGLNQLGLPAGAHSAILPVVLGTPARALSAAAALREGGIWVKAIRPPTVPEGRSLLRFAISAAHQKSDLESCLQVLERTGLKNG